jgi:hypothetical protein
MNMGLSLVPAILLVFYLYLVVRWQHVKRPMFFCLGVLAMVGLLFFAGFFGWTAARWANVLRSIVGTLTAIVAFGCALAACWGEKLPMGLDKTTGTQTSSMPQTPAPATPSEGEGGGA